MQFRRERRSNGVCHRDGKPMVIRYADDFVVVHAEQQVIEQAWQLAATWLAGIGLELKPTKTRICHTLVAPGVASGFDFLGFTVRQFPLGWHRARPRADGTRQGFKTLIKPSRKAQHRHYANLTEVIRRKRTAPQAALIEELNPKIRGWANFNSTQVSTDVYSRLDHLRWRRLWRWGVRRHPKKSRRWVRLRYWTTAPDPSRRQRRRSRAWLFQDRRSKVTLCLHRDTPIQRHVKVKDRHRPFDGDLLYWAKRLREHPELPRRISALLRDQRGRRNWCGLTFLTIDELIEVDHAIPRVRGGLKLAHNEQLLHGHCHDAKTAIDGSNLAVLWRYQP